MLNSLHIGSDGGVDISFSFTGLSICGLWVAPTHPDHHFTKNSGLGQMRETLTESGVLTGH